MSDNYKLIINVNLNELKLILDKSVLLLRSVNNSVLMSNLLIAKQLSNSIICFNQTWEEKIKLNENIINVFSEIQKEFSKEMIFSLNLFNVVIHDSTNRFDIIFKNEILNYLSECNQIIICENHYYNDFNLINALGEKSKCKNIIIYGFDNMPNLSAKLSISFSAKTIEKQKSNLFVNDDFSLTYKYKLSNLKKYIDSIIYFGTDNCPINITQLYLNS